MDSEDSWVKLNEASDCNSAKKGKEEEKL